jgi:hypothetical protein
MHVDRIAGDGDGLRRTRADERDDRCQRGNQQAMDMQAWTSGSSSLFHVHTPAAFQRRGL